MARIKHKRLGREMLLPLPAQKARALSLEYHLALSVLARGRGGFDQAARLLQAICHARLIAGPGNADAGLLDEAESALDAIGSRVNAGGAWTVTDAEGAAIASALSIHDQLTAREPYHRFVAAWAQMQQLGRELQGKVKVNGPLPFEPMGLCRFLEDGIRRYRAENDGLCPALIVLSQAQYDELQRDPQGWSRIASEMDGEIPGIAIDEQWTAPYLLGENLQCYEL